jgi:hypothetical protein
MQSNLTNISIEANLMIVAYHWRLHHNLKIRAPPGGGGGGGLEEKSLESPGRKPGGPLAICQGDLCGES